MKYNYHIYILKMLLLLSVIATLIMTGCVSPNPIKSEAMIPDNFELKNKYPYSVSIDVLGGNNPTCINYCITRKAFLDAVTLSLMKAEAFSSVTNKEDAYYFLDIVIAKNWTDKRSTSTIVTQWELTNVDSTNVIWSEIITTTKSISGWGNKLKKANEGVAKENIKNGINKLSSHMQQF